MIKPVIWTVSHAHCNESLSSDKLWNSGKCRWKTFYVSLLKRQLTNFLAVKKLSGKTPGHVSCLQKVFTQSWLNWYRQNCQNVTSGLKVKSKSHEKMCSHEKQERKRFSKIKKITHTTRGYHKTNLRRCAVKAEVKDENGVRWKWLHNKPWHVVSTECDSCRH